MAEALTVDTLKKNGTAPVATWRERANTYAAGIGRLLSESAEPGSKTYIYDADGNIKFATRQAADWGDPADDRFTYYGADGRVRAADFRSRANDRAINTPRQWVFEEYRYDPLGRRVWVRTYRECENYQSQPEQALECISSLRRTIWNDQQELIEIQVPGADTVSGADLENDNYLPSLGLVNSQDPNPYYGRVLYVHGLELDQPVAITRYHYVTIGRGNLT